MADNHAAIGVMDEGVVTRIYLALGSAPPAWAVDMLICLYPMPTHFLYLQESRDILQERLMERIASGYVSAIHGSQDIEYLLRQTDEINGFIERILLRYTSGREIVTFNIGGYERSFELYRVSPHKKWPFSSRR